MIVNTAGKTGPSMARFLGSWKGPKRLRISAALILGALGSLPLVLLTPPFQVPDEVQHFYRAYQLSEFQIRAEVRNGVSGGTLPVSLQRLVTSSVYTQDALAYPATPAPLGKTLKLASIPLDSSTRAFVAFPGSAFYSPLPYLPQVAGIALGRAIGLGPLGLLYMGRLFNCLAALALIALAVGAIPFAEEFVILVALLPMSLYLYASLSADAAVISCSLAFTALSLSASKRGEWKTWEFVAAAVAAAVFCSVKPVYAPLLLAGMVPGLFQSNKAARVTRSHAILLVIAVGAAAGWLLFTRSSMTTPLSGAHPSVQISLVLHHPLLLIRAIVHTFTFNNLLLFYVQTVGAFGWLTVSLRPGVAYLLPLAGLLFVCIVGVRDPADSEGQRAALPALWYLALVLASAFLIMTAMYLMYAVVGGDAVPGVQGRYFIPLLVLAGVGVTGLLPRGRRPASRRRNLAVLVLLGVLEVIAMDTTIVRAFQVWGRL